MKVTWRRLRRRIRVGEHAAELALEVLLLLHLRVLPREHVVHAAEVVVDGGEVLVHAAVALAEACVDLLHDHVDRGRPHAGLGLPDEVARPDEPRHEHENEPEVGVPHEPREDAHEVAVVAGPDRDGVRLVREQLVDEARQEPRADGEQPHEQLPPGPAVLDHEELQVHRPDHERHDGAAVLPQRHHVAVVAVAGLDEPHRHVGDDEALDDGLADPAPEVEEVEVHVVDAGRVERRDLHGRRVPHVAVPDAHEQHRQRREHDVVELHRGLDEELLAAVQRPEGHPEVGHREDEVLVEDVEHGLGRAPVVVPALHHEQAPQEAELGDGEVAVVHGLHALLPGHAHAHVRRLDHGHVVRAVANSEAQHVLVGLADHVHDLLLLLRRDAAADYGVAEQRETQQLVPVFLVLEAAAQAHAVHHEGKGRL
mmetsp:Transcript_41388/g.129602  ORF Transcript_41388/g.129602 Transcript_41388/m.129602 type:complete len:425 (-) Transcript_41388:2934-4208(-)